ncbi:MAG: methyltransferase domain-containing protein [Spirochaetales bacterium]|nr:methyltransferase domain-containing protein [Spirochaetales bacterium]
MKEEADFNELAYRLEEKVYSSAKGLIRLSLIQNDLTDFVPGFSDSQLHITDAGGGSGHFAFACARSGHRVRLIETSERMLQLARKKLENEKDEIRGRIELIQADYLKAPPSPFKTPADLICLHGSAEWMRDSRKAIRKACGELPSGGYLSLLIFNTDRQILKRGINGQLHRQNRSDKRRRLTPPGGLSSQEARDLLSDTGTILLQSGIRIFYDFFRQFDPGTLSDDQWLEQEKEWYRKEPFNGLGEHSHFIWRKN